MKRIAFVWALAWAAAGMTAGADVTSASAVYIMPMANGLDQYLALRLTTGNVLQVVTDPLRADVVLTDRVGAGFDDKWKELYPPPKVEKSDAKGKDGKDKINDEVFTVSRGASQGSARGRGAIFLIDRSTRNVVWSTFARQKSSGSDDMEKVADQIAKELAKARKGPAAK